MASSHVRGVDDRPAGAAPRARGPARSGRRLWRELTRNRLASIGAVYLVLIVGVAALAPAISPYPPDDQDLLNRLNPPSAAHWLGTDEAGRDELSRLMYGARVSLSIAVLGTLGGVALGTVLGLAAGFLGGTVDQIAMRVVDVMYAFPGILLAIFIVAVIGPNLLNLVIALTVFNTPTLARIVRASVLSLKPQEFIEAARATGATRPRIVVRHLVPNTLAPIIVNATLSVAAALLTAAALGFLGVGVQPPTAEWGAMLSSGKDYMRNDSALVTLPGLLILVTVLAVNLVGDTLRDALDPHLR